VIVCFFPDVIVAEKEPGVASRSAGLHTPMWKHLRIFSVQSGCDT
jgi:hypothetical protein